MKTLRPNYHMFSVHGTYGPLEHGLPRALVQTTR